RLGYGREKFIPHNLTMTVTGAGLLWFGWFGFNAGSALAAGQSAALAFVTTHVAAGAAAMSWAVAEWIHRKRPTMLGLVSGLVAGLRAAGAWSALLTVAILFVVDKTLGLRVTPDEEREGLDTSQHGETGYTN